LERLDSDFLEKLIIKGMMTDKNFLVLVTSVFEPGYFDDSSISHIFKFCRDYVSEYSEIPQRETVINSLPDEFEQNDIKEIFDDIDTIDYDIARNYNHLVDQTNDFLKEQAVKNAIIESVDIVEDKERRPEIRQKIENALTKDIKIDLGLDYFGDLGDRLTRIFTASDIKIPTYYPQFDEYLNGGFPPFTLSVLTARIHGFKSNTMANFAARQVLHGHNVVLMTLEMAQDAFAQRFDSIYTGLDINRIYVSNTFKNRLTRKLAEVKAQEGRGSLLIKQFPTGDASVLDFTIYLRELLIRGIITSIIYVDYINLMKTAYKVERNMYSAVNRIAEELRALSFAVEIPVVSVSQLNREGSFVGFEELDFTYIAESLGLPATADFMAIMGTDDDAMVYQNELLYKIVKNRLGGRVGEVDRLYYDSRSLKMYDSTELELWQQDATTSGDSRDIAPTPNHREEANRTRGRRNR
jgi:replicative DNA helicase